LWCESWIDTRRAQIEQFFNAGFSGRLNDVGADRKVLVDESRRVFVVGIDPADLRGRHNDSLWLICLHPGFNVHLAR
jgi:hypothetical protein